MVLFLLKLSYYPQAIPLSTLSHCELMKCIASLLSSTTASIGKSSPSHLLMIYPIHWPLPWPRVLSTLISPSGIGIISSITKSPHPYLLLNTLLTILTGGVLSSKPSLEFITTVFTVTGYSFHS